MDILLVFAILNLLYNIADEFQTVIYRYTWKEPTYCDKADGL